MKTLIFFLTLFTAFPALSFDNDTAGTSGDVLRILLPAAAYSATVVNNDKEGRKEFLKSFSANIAATYSLKEFIKKDRPDGSGDDSFPSGHASMAFQAASFLQERYGRMYGMPAYALAAYTSWTRLAVDEHDIEDVSVGAALGIASGLIFTSPSGKAVLFPLIGRQTFGLSFSARW
ncbi:phosphatase PAP2 family protein [Seleniivibrio woodruffii]|uniref:phosphatase PAP2 family protein n=1 Tax=Seleniivibrio woodruffii TaxID=1078050 RepID=UPI00240A3685|nr:phosphatase PAP2 family protein [Seleniivibrio woodruffii]